MDKNILCEDPIIYTIDNFLSPEECDHFIKVSKDKLERALVSGDSKGFVSKGRSGQNCWIPHNKDTILLGIATRISQLVDYPLKNAESFQFIYYNEEQKYGCHYDSWKFDKSEKSARCLKRGGQRMVTALVYLNDVEEGGDTRFTRLDLNVKPSKGRLLVFHDTLKGTNIVHPLSEHSGTSVIKGEKYAFNLWFRQQDRKLDYIHNYDV